MHLEVVFLGTASAVPTAKKNHSGFLVKTEKETILIDCGEGIQRQFKKAGENASKLTKILITHWHEDHTIGLPPLLKSLGMNEYAKTLEIYGPRGSMEKIELFETIYSRYKIPIEIKEITKDIVCETDEIRIESRSLDHGIPTKGYSITLKDKVRIDKEKLTKLKLPNSPLIGKLQRGEDIDHNGKKIKAKDITYIEKGKKIAIVMDTALCENAIELAKNADLLICESSYDSTESDRAKEYQHLTTIQAATIAKKAKAVRLALVHISQKHEFRIKDLVAEAQTVFKNAFAPEDKEHIIVTE
jgi:ribonuclease Z